jgi:hypothetical protein
MKIPRDCRAVRLLVLLPAALLLSACTRAPSVDVMGSFFPAWLVCLMVAIVLTSLVRFAVLRLQIKVAVPLLLYPSLLAFFTFALWLVLFY